MRPSLALLSYALVVATLGAHLLRRATWPERGPRLGVLAWQALSGSVVVSVVLAGLGLAMPFWWVSLDLAELLDTCVMLLRAQYSTPGGAVLGSTGLLVAIGVVARVGYCTARTVGRARIVRARQRQQVTLAARRDPRLDAWVVDHATSAAYCVPGALGRSGLVVVSSAALDVLDADQVAAVLQHERAHLVGRHHLVIQAAASLRAAFPFVPVFKWAAEAVECLVEVLADDAAARRGDRQTLATALVRLAEHSAPVGALGAGGSTVVIRVRRLATPSSPLGGVWTMAAATGVLVIALIPLAVVATPALAVASSDYCPISVT